MSAQIHSYTELQQQIQEDLRIQHPEWIEANGNCPTCDSYEARLAELLKLTQRSHTTGSLNHSPKRVMSLPSRKYGTGRKHGIDH